MKKMYKTNNWLVIITILLCFTFWGGVIALPILGLVQIIMSFKIIIHFNELKNTIKALFSSYVILTFLLIVFFKYLQIADLAIMFFWMIISIFLASFHLYITYKISKSEQQYSDEKPETKQQYQL